MSAGSDRREGKRWLRGALRLAVGGSVAAATITLAPLGASAAGGWSIVSSPGSAAAGGMVGVAATSGLAAKAAVAAALNNKARKIRMSGNFDMIAAVTVQI